jgi:bacillopeptidase F
MKKIVLVFGLLIVVGFVVAQEKSPQAPFEALQPVPCPLVYVANDWDFTVSDQGFTTTTCDATGGAPVWEWGTSDIAGAPGTVWGTVLVGNYPTNAGEGLLSPAFDVTSITDKMEILSYLHTETNFDGVNVTVNDAVLQPVDTYPATISTSTSYYAYCTDDEPGWTGNSFTGPSQDWVQQCFDLSAFDGQTIQVRFDFGSDSSVTYPGWYLGYVRIGDDIIPVELQSLDVE